MGLVVAVLNNRRTDFITLSDPLTGLQVFVNRVSFELSLSSITYRKIRHKI